LLAFKEFMHNNFCNNQNENWYIILRQ
jgi:hypothetical protein